MESTPRRFADQVTRLAVGLAWAALIVGYSFVAMLMLTPIPFVATFYLGLPFPWLVIGSAYGIMVLAPIAWSLWSNSPRDNRLLEWTAKVLGVGLVLFVITSLGCLVYYSSRLQPAAAD